MSNGQLDRELELFKKLIDENRYDFCKLVFIIFPFGEPGHELENKLPYTWQMEEWAAMSEHFSNPETRDQAYRLVISSGNGAAKTAFGAMTNIMLMYTHKLKARITANTDPQIKTVVWPEYDKWFRSARYVDHFFDKFGTSIKAKDEKLADNWRIDTVTWSEQNPAAISGLHNQGNAVAYTFEEAPGIPSIIWQYASGAFTEIDTIKLFMAFGNSDDPESQFEQNMASPMWRARRIDTRTLSHISKDQVRAWLIEAGGDEDNDDFRVRVRGLPRKSAKDSIIKIESVQAAIAKRIGFDKMSVEHFPVVLSCDPAWQGGDETVIWYKQGHYTCLLERYKLQKRTNETHQMTYNKLCYWERQLKADAVHIDQGEGTAIYTLAMNAEKFHWILIAFGSNPTDNPDPSKSEYKNVRAMMYHHGQKFLMNGGIIDSRESQWLDDIQKQLCWTKGTYHKITHQKMCESKLDLKARVGRSPDLSDGWVLLFAYDVIDKLPQHELGYEDDGYIGQSAMKFEPYMPNYDQDNYDLYD